MVVCDRLRGLGAACAFCAVGLVCGAALAATPAKPKGSGQKHVVEMSPWEQATHAREVLEAIPNASRTKADYAKALDGYRAIYHDSPQSKYAAPAVNAVAELLGEQGRDLNDAKSLKAAIGQYEFLRTQYPGSSLRVAALLAEGQIYENDLHDASSARERYALFLKQYPHSSQAEEARAGLASLDQPKEPKQDAGKTAQVITARGATDAPTQQSSRGAATSSLSPMPTTPADTAASE